MTEKGFSRKNASHTHDEDEGGVGMHAKNDIYIKKTHPSPRSSRASPTHPPRTVSNADRRDRRRVGHHRPRTMRARRRRRAAAPPDEGATISRRTPTGRPRRSGPRRTGSAGVPRTTPPRPRCARWTGGQIIRRRHHHRRFRDDGGGRGARRRRRRRRRRRARPTRTASTKARGVPLGGGTGGPRGTGTRSSGRRVRWTIPPPPVRVGGPWRRRWRRATATTTTTTSTTTTAGRSSGRQQPAVGS